MSTKYQGVGQSSPNKPFFKKPAFIILVVLVAGFGLWKFFLQEYLAYKSAMGAEEYFDIYSYTWAYPNGAHIEEVTNRADDFLFASVKRRHENEEPVDFLQYYADFPNGKHYQEIKQFEAELEFEKLKGSITPLVNNSLSRVNTFSVDFPEFESMDEVSKLKEMIWDSLIFKYETLLPSNNTPLKAVTFFKAYLDFMKKNDKSNIFVHLEAEEIDLMAYDDYSEKVRSLLDQTTKDVNAYNASQIISFAPTYPLPSKNLPASPKSFYSDAEIQNYEKSFRDGFKSQFKRAIGFAPFSVEEYGEKTDRTNEVVVDVKFSISNLHERYQGVDLPILYNITTTPTGSLFSTFDGYAFGLSTVCDIRMIIPGVEETFQFSGSYEPDDHLYGIEGMSTVYKKISESTFDALAQDFVAHFGIKTPMK